MLDNTFDAARSWMMCHTLKDEVMAKAAGRGADVVVFDLEDGVTTHAKAEARAIAARMLPQLQGCSIVRINDPVTASELALEDVRAMSVSALRGIMVPKVESAEALTRVYEVLHKSAAYRTRRLSYPPNQRIRQSGIRMPRRAGRGTRSLHCAVDKRQS